MPELQVHATALTSQYIAQVSGDLARNVKEQERVSAEIDLLQEQLLALQHDHTVLVSVQDALGGASTAKDITVVPTMASTLPQQSNPPKIEIDTSTEATTFKKRAAKASSTKSPETAARTTLVNLIRSHLEQQDEPRSAAEIFAALMQAYPDRVVKATVVRTTLEGLVAKSQAQRNKQGSSVFYSAAVASEPAATNLHQEAVAG
ncbi:hypothetical protein ACIOEW_39830 [Streptomyces sp. NPDC087901]|uniref:hypothetical protein n=1 Tax=Streptomyces sp. NPDC087901 TaxID=3365818 RepID=UPI0038036609